LSVDTAIVGGGITGLTTAMLLAEAGQRVALVEAKAVGGGTTGNSTGNLYATVGPLLSRLVDKWGAQTMEAVVRSRASAVDLVEHTVRRRGIECAFARRSWHLFAMPGNDGHEKVVENEYETARSAPLVTRRLSRAPLPFDTGSTLVIDGQAQLNPAAYVRGLARAIDSPGCRIFEQSPAHNIEPGKSVVETSRGRLQADNLVVATHVPKGFNIVQTELGPYREYAIAATLRSGDYPEGIFWSAGDERHSIRSHAVDASRYLVVIGPGHKTGQEPHTERCYRRIESFVRTHFDVDAITHRWSAQGYYPADEIPYIGRSASASHLYVATGYAADGLTYGTLAGMILADEILGRPNDFSSLYKATRVKPVKSAKAFLRENIDVAAQYVKGFAGGTKIEALRDLARGQGEIIEVHGKKIAAYRDQTGTVSALSPVCTHLKCLVRWNEAEQSWDCPCHGSRFGIDGAVIEGPALAPLERIDLDQA
jgi:glycine/D-amino acid oxidase-like deaminating enzyme/nitrite reductase/ring-hydroxylating ferredoxin subunit